MVCKQTVSSEKKLKIQETLTYKSHCFNQQQRINPSFLTAYVTIAVSFELNLFLVTGKENKACEIPTLDTHAWTHMTIKYLWRNAELD